MMAALSSVWQDSDVSLCNYLGCGKEGVLCCLGVVMGSPDLRREGGGREEGGVGCSDDDLPPTSSK